MRRAFLLLLVVSGCGGSGGSAPEFSGSWSGTWAEKPVSLTVSAAWDPNQDIWPASAVIGGVRFNGGVTATGHAWLKAGSVRYVADLDKAGSSLTGHGFSHPGSVPFTASLSR